MRGSIREVDKCFENRSIKCKFEFLVSYSRERKWKNKI